MIDTYGNDTFEIFFDFQEIEIYYWVQNLNIVFWKLGKFISRTSKILPPQTSFLDNIGVAF